MISSTEAQSENSAQQRGSGLNSFMFATGFENSYPVITARDGTDLRVDELEKTRFYDQWRQDFQLVKEIGVKYLRYGPQYYRAHLGKRKYDWSFADETFAELRSEEHTSE